jgi:hypothetical protein
MTAKPSFQPLKWTYNMTLSELYNKLCDNEVSFIEFLDLINQREMDAFKRGFEKSADLLKGL